MITDLLYAVASTLPTHGMPSGTMGGVLAAALVWFAPIVLATVLTLIAACLLFKPRSYFVPLLLCALAICTNIAEIILASSLDSLFKTETIFFCALLIIIEAILVGLLMFKNSSRES